MCSSLCRIACYHLDGGKITNTCSFQGNSYYLPWFFLCHIWRKKCKTKAAKEVLNNIFYLWFILLMWYRRLGKKQFHGFLIRKVATFSEWICTSEEILNIVLLHTDILILKRVELVENWNQFLSFPSIPINKHFLKTNKNYSYTSQI